MFCISHDVKNGEAVQSAAIVVYSNLLPAEGGYLSPRPMCSDRDRPFRRVDASRGGQLQEEVHGVFFG